MVAVERVGDVTRAFLLVALVVVAACGGAGGSGDGDSEAAASVVSIETTTPVVETEGSLSPGIQPEGFTTIRAQVTKPDGEVCEICLWLADDSEERSRGLMGVTDLGEPVGMAFLFDEAVNGSFFMFQTPTPLSIAWFAVDGSIVAVAEMVPCLDTPRSDCQRYSPDNDYQLVVEAFEGQLAAIGIEPGSSVRLVAGTESLTCT